MIVNSSLEPTLRTWKSGSTAGSSSVTLATQQLPQHLHPVGKLDEALYERGMLATDGLPFQELKQRALIDSRSDLFAHGIHEACDPLVVLSTINPC